MALCLPAEASRERRQRADDQRNRAGSVIKKGRSHIKISDQGEGTCDPPRVILGEAKDLITGV